MARLESIENFEILSQYVLRHIDEDGTEYFTIKTTGKSGMSYRGLARFVGVRQPAIHGLIKKLKHMNPESQKFSRLPDCLKPFVGQELVLEGYIDPQRRKILEDSFCAAVTEYYAEHSPFKNELRVNKAKQALEEIQRLGTQVIRDHKQEVQHLGMRKYIHLKTGYDKSTNYTNNSKTDDFDFKFANHKERLTLREILKKELDPMLKSAIQYYQKKYRKSRKIFPDTLDELNKIIHGLRAKQIKSQNNLSKSAAIRDYFETRIQMNYSALHRLAANLILDDDIHPVAAVKKAGKLYFSTRYEPQPIVILENVYKADKRLEAEKEVREQLKAQKSKENLGLSAGVHSQKKKKEKVQNSSTYIQLSLALDI